jgi:hypothetical protein
MTGSVAWSNAEIAEIFSDVLRKECGYHAVDTASFSDHLRAQDLDAFQMRFILELQELADMDEFSFIGDGIYSILNRRPNSFYAFAMEHHQCWQGNALAEDPIFANYSGPKTRNVSSNVVRPLATLW